MTSTKEFQISLFEIGDCKSCLFSYLCTHCAASQARSQMDGSSCCFNFLAMNPIATRWLVRSAYGIPGTACGDICSVLCCPCCSMNQLYQTTAEYGAPTTDSGRINNNAGFATQATNENCCTNCLYSFFCCPCAIGTSLSNAVDMPCWFGCCCVNLCSSRSIVRYQYRISGDDCCDDCLVPTMVASLLYACGIFCVPCVLPYFLNILMKLLAETDARSVKGNWPKRFLASNPNSTIGNIPVAFLQQPMQQMVSLEQPMQPMVTMQQPVQPMATQQYSVALVAQQDPIETSAPLDVEVARAYNEEVRGYEPVKEYDLVRQASDSKQL